MINPPKHWSLILLGFLFILTHLLFLTRLPIFNDESIYLDWGWRSLHAPGLAFYSLADAKPPLAIWYYGLTYTFGPHNPLFTGRLLAVLASLATLVGLFKLAQTFKPKPFPLVTGIIFLITPLLVFYDRQILLEAPLCALFVWILVAVNKLRQNRSTANLGLLTLFFTLALLIKFSALILLISLCLGSLVIYFHRRSRPNLEFLAFIVTAALASCLLLLPLLSQTPLRQSLSSLNRYAHIGLSVSSLVSNALTFFAISFFHLTLPLCLLFLLGLSLAVRHSQFRFITLVLLINFVLLLFTANTLTPRYTEPFLIFSPLFIALALQSLISNQHVRLILIPALLTLPLFLTLVQNAFPDRLFSFYSRFTSVSLASEYVTDWTSGYGLPQVVAYLQNQSRQNPLIVAVRLDAGNPESAMHAFFVADQNIQVTYLDASNLPPDFASYGCLKTTAPLYFVSRDGNLAGLDPFFDPIATFPKPFGSYFIGLSLAHSRCGQKPLELNLTRQN